MKLHSAWLASAMLFAALLACNMAKNGNSNDQTAASKSNPDVKVIGTFTNRRHVVNKYILVEKGVSNDKLIELATRLHHAEPKANFWFMDDDSRSAEMLKWVQAYEKGEATLSDPISDWISDHTVANVQEYFGEGGTRYWAVAKGMMGDRIAKIE